MDASTRNDDLTGESEREGHGHRSNFPITNLLIVVLTFLMFRFLTAPVSGGDTLRYAADAAKHAAGLPGQFWEFGHLLWRPLAFAGLSFFGQIFKTYFHDNDMQAAARFLIVLNFFTGLGAVLLFWDVMRKLTSNSMATLTAVAFCSANAFLSLVCLGTAYLTALLFQVLALWLFERAAATPQRTTFYSALAGLCFGCSILFWFPFVVSGLGVILAPLLWMSEDTRREESVRILLRNAVPFLLALVVTTTTVFSIGAANHGIHDLAGLIQWIQEAGNGWTQSGRVVRAATGLPRMLFDLTPEGLLLKRWFLHDPFHPVHLSDVVLGPLLKLGVYYLGILCLGYLLVRSRSKYGLLVVLAAAFIPMLFFALVLFEPSGAERFLPILVFLFLGIAVAFQRRPPRSIAAFVLALLLVSVFVCNLAALSFPLARETALVRSQKSELEAALNHRATVLILTLHEPFYLIPISRPLDHSVWSSSYDVSDLIEPASKRVLHWRGEFAQTTLASWGEGKEVWVSASVYAPTPPKDSTWAEGDDKRVSWKDIHSFFQNVQTDKATGGPEGFVRIAEQDSNRNKLSELAKQDAPAQ